MGLDIQFAGLVPLLGWHFVHRSLEYPAIEASVYHNPDYGLLNGLRESFNPSSSPSETTRQQLLPRHVIEIKRLLSPNQPLIFADWINYAARFWDRKYFPARKMRGGGVGIETGRTTLEIRVRGQECRWCTISECRWRSRTSGRRRDADLVASRAGLADLEDYGAR